VRRARLSTEDGLDCLTDALVDRTEGFLEAEDGDDEVEVEAYADDARRRGGQSGQLPLFLEELYLLTAGRTSRSSAFATFRTLGAAAVAASTKLSHRAFTTGQEKGAKFPTSKALISASFHSFRLILGRAIIPRSALEASMLFLGRARVKHSR
jgi:hypothetical protein